MTEPASVDVPDKRHPPPDDLDLEAADRRPASPVPASGIASLISSSRSAGLSA